MLDPRGQLLRAALGFAGCPLPSYDRALWALRTWLDSWPGVGHVAVGMHRQGYDLQLTQDDDRGWRATFYTTGMEHSPTSATGTAWQRTPWHATQRGVWEGVEAQRGRPDRRSWPAVYSSPYSVDLRRERPRSSISKGRRARHAGSQRPESTHELETIMMRARGHLRKALFIFTSMCLIVATQAPVVVSQPANKPPPDAATDSEGKPLPGTSIPCAPVAEKRQELGCYVVARQRLGALPQGMPLSWHLNVFPDRAAAEAAKGQFGTVAEAFDRTWLFTIAPPDWRPIAGVEHVATVGPLPLEPRAAEYTAVYLATTFRPGLSSSVHKHSGPEAWFIVSGEQCLETPDGLIWGRAGEGVAVRGELPMIVQATGSEIRRSFALILHDAAKASSTPVDHWKPQGLCRN